ncbi:hypothetical protein P152DRAFT_379166, partial [Eremomyces bilateralis CBS 781.70]
YFGYGSNMWQWQMSQRCPNSVYLGVGRLYGWRWIINERGYANVVELKAGKDNRSDSTSIQKQGREGKDANAADNSVYGLVYTLTESDEANLDLIESVPQAYTKETHEVELWPSPGMRKPVNMDLAPRKVMMLTYVDRKRVTEARPQDEYVSRLNTGLIDALKEGVPKEWIDRVIRMFIPETKEDD